VTGLALSDAIQTTLCRPTLARELFAFKEPGRLALVACLTVSCAVVRSYEGARRGELAFAWNPIADVGARAVPSPLSSARSRSRALLLATSRALRARGERPALAWPRYSASTSRRSPSG
jgi:hypothetical protein